MNRPDTELFLDDHRGIYIPRDFAECIVRTCLSGVSGEELDILAKGPHDNEFYWEIWDDVLSNAIITDEHGVKFSLHQSGALWLIPEGMSWSDKDEFFVWPEDESEDA